MKKTFLIILSIFLSLQSYAQAVRREAALWTFMSLTKPMGDRWSLSGQTEIRTGDNFADFYLWYLDGSVKYKLNNWITLSTGIDYIKIHSAATATRGSLWRTDWRPFIGIIPNWKMGKIRASLFGSLSYNWLPEDNVDGVKVSGKAYYLVRHKLSLSYPISNSKFTPQFAFELRNTKKLERIRLTLGTAYKFDQRNAMELALIYQDKHYGTKSTALSVGYRYTLL